MTPHETSEVLDPADMPLLFFILDEAATREFVGDRPSCADRSEADGTGGRPNMTVEWYPSVRVSTLGCWDRS